MGLLDVEDAGRVTQAEFARSIDLELLIWNVL
jgi:hypothetical protein